MSNPHYLKPAKTSPVSKKKSLGGGGEETDGTKLDVSSIPISRVELGVDLVIG